MKKNLILAGEYYTHTPSKKQRIHNISMNTPVIKSIPVQDAYGTGKRGHASWPLFAQSNPNTTLLILIVIIIINVFVLSVHSRYMPYNYNSYLKTKATVFLRFKQPRIS
jgi:hypothetical protein